MLTYTQPNKLVTLRRTGGGGGALKTAEAEGQDVERPFRKSSTRTRNAVVSFSKAETDHRLRLLIQ